ncbi:MAG TPA: stalk domain-containing protein, partial [Candidatus Binatia bacterium]|nr:stalk domain-containing protein [Candidatus Binatia bacterium]
MKTALPKGRVRAAMRIVPLLLLAFAAVSPASTPPPSRLSHIYFLGNEYVRLDDWGRANGFQAQWTVWKEEIKLTSPNLSMVFNIDSRRMLLNGVSIWLSTPIAFRNGAAYVA